MFKYYASFILLLLFSTVLEKKIKYIRLTHFKDRSSDDNMARILWWKGAFSVFQAVCVYVVAVGLLIFVDANDFKVKIDRTVAFLGHVWVILLNL